MTKYWWQFGTNWSQLSIKISQEPPINKTTRFSCKLILCICIDYNDQLVTAGLYCLSLLQIQIIRCFYWPFVVILLLFQRYLRNQWNLCWWWHKILSTLLSLYTSVRANVWFFALDAHRSCRVCSRQINVSKMAVKRKKDSIKMMQRFFFFLAE